VLEDVRHFGALAAVRAERVRFEFAGLVERADGIGRDDGVPAVDLVTGALELVCNESPLPSTRVSLVERKKRQERTNRAIPVEHEYARRALLGTRFGENKVCTLRRNYGARLCAEKTLEVCLRVLDFPVGRVKFAPREVPVIGFRRARRACRGIGVGEVGG
jgi:hypothetical protein